MKGEIFKEDGGYDTLKRVADKHNASCSSILAWG